MAFSAATLATGRRGTSNTVGLRRFPGRANAFFETTVGRNTSSIIVQTDTVIVIRAGSDLAVISTEVANTVAFVPLKIGVGDAFSAVVAGVLGGFLGTSGVRFAGKVKFR
eukprot:91761_1